MLTVDAHVPAGSVVVAVVDRPRHPLGEARRHGDGQPSAGSQDAHQFGDRLLVTPEVLEHLRRDDAVEGVVGEREAQRVTVDLAAVDVAVLRIAGNLAGFDHRTAYRPYVLQFGSVVVERDHGRAVPQCRERVAPAAAPHVEESVAGAQAEAIEVDGEHQAAPEGARASRSAR